MKNTPKALSALVFFAVSTVVSAQALKDAPTTLRTGNWSVLRSVDTMTDKVRCTGIYRSNYGVQLAAAAMYVKISGGIQSVTLRFGEDAPQAMRLPEKMEKEVNTVIIEGREFSQAVETNRLRIQALTLVRGMATEDLDVTGIKEAVDHIRSDCPIPPPASVPVTAPAPVLAATAIQETRAPLATEKPCTDQLLTRLRAAGVTDKQINAACRRN